MSIFAGSSGPVDRRVGARIRARRELLGLTPETLGERLGCAPSLILDYEAGLVRAGPATLLELTRALKVEIGYFLSGLADDAPPPPQAARAARDKLNS
jgi:transcriptional regulator with XRE-family HTH domain